MVGDDDQSIYSWRGANFENLRLFEQDFPEYAEIKLEQNYRSTSRILAVANGLIRNNTTRKPKSLWSSLGEGEQVTVVLPEDETQEAEYIAGAIRSAALRQRLPLSQFGVLVRTNSLTRALEEAFVRENLPYAVSGGMSFFQRAEVKDLLAYLRVMANPDDEVSLVRILNTPRRGIGRRTLEAAVQTARARTCSLFGALNVLQAGEAGSALAEKTREPIGEFLELLEEFRDRFHKGKRQMAAALRDLVDRIDYWGHLVQENPKGSVARWKLANVESLVDSLAAYEQDPDNLDPSLYQYLNRVTLASREDGQGEDGEQKVQLMTIHAAKGLEFDTVFVAAVEKDLIPHARAVEEGEANMEEERRLFLRGADPRQTPPDPERLPGSPPARGAQRGAAFRLHRGAPPRAAGLPGAGGEGAGPRGRLAAVRADERGYREARPPVSRVEPVLLRVEAIHAGLRAEAFLALKCPTISRTRLKQKIMTGEVRVNGNRLATSTRLRAGDLLAARLAGGARPPGGAGGALRGRQSSGGEQAGRAGHPPGRRPPAGDAHPERAPRFPRPDPAQPGGGRSGLLPQPGASPGPLYKWCSAHRQGPPDPGGHAPPAGRRGVRQALSRPGMRRGGLPCRLPAREDRGAHRPGPVQPGAAQALYPAGRPAARSRNTRCWSASRGTPCWPPIRSPDGSTRSGCTWPHWVTPCGET